MLALEGLSKRFPGVVALDGVSLSIPAGEMHALAGENGAGKSSLIRLLAGIHRPDAGAMRLAGEAYAPSGPLDAIRAGVRVVHQELNLLPALSIAENLAFERLPRRFGLIDRRRLDERARALLASVGLDDLDPRRPVAGLGIAQCQLIEIARVVGPGEASGPAGIAGGRVLILDEPTATLTPRESGRLFELIARLRARGMTMIYVSHHLAEIFAMCDRVSVLRNGRLVETLPTAETSPPALIRAMIGRDLATRAPRPPAAAGPAQPPALELRGLRPRAAPSAPGHAAGDGLDLALHYGEVVGIAGLVGAGRTEVLRAIFGADGRAPGMILRDGRPVRIASPTDATRLGIALLTEDRKAEGLVLPMSAAVNTTLAAIGRVARGGVLRRRAERDACVAQARRLRTRLSGPRQPVVELSGGNQQKVVLAKWLFAGARVLLLDEPTRGIDVGAKAEIYDLIDALVAGGHAVMVVSSGLPELMTLADRVVVLSRGRIAGELARPDFSEERILELAYSRFLKPA